MCERPHTLIFGKSLRDDLTKLFLGRDAVAYVSRNTPGPGAYELRRQRPFSLFPTNEPGTTIGGPLANIDRVRTGPLAASYHSFTPGPGAYDDDNDRGIKFSPSKGALRKQPGGCNRAGERGQVQTRATSGSYLHDMPRAVTSASVASSVWVPAKGGAAAASRKWEANGRRQIPSSGRAGCFRNDITTQPSWDSSAPQAKNIAKGKGASFSISPFRFLDQQVSMKASQKAINQTRMNELI